MERTGQRSRDSHVKAAVCSRYGPPDVIQIMDIEKPVPKDNEVLIEVPLKMGADRKRSSLR
jgi:hypothetical protein